MRKTEGFMCCDTIQINTYQTPAQQTDGLHAKAKQNINTGLLRLIINPNTHAHTDIIDNANQSITSCIDVLAQADISDYTVSRLDLAYNMFNVGAFKEHEKLNRLFLMMIANQYSDDNLIFVYDQLNQLKSMKIINQYFDAENYDKSREEPDGAITNRLEFRFKRLRAENLDEAYTAAYNRLIKLIDKCITRQNYKAVMEKCTMQLLTQLANQTEETRHKTIEKVLFKEHEKLIFNANQLTVFYEAIDKHDPHRKAQTFMRLNNVERISYNMIENYANQLKKAAEKFIKSTSKIVTFEEKITA